MKNVTGLLAFENVTGALIADSANGSVVYESVSKPVNEIQISTINGNVELDVPADLGGGVM